MTVLTLALHERLRGGAPALAQVATALGLIWAALVIASGMVGNVGVATVVDLLRSDRLRRGRSGWGSKPCSWDWGAGTRSQEDSGSWS